MAYTTTASVTWDQTAYTLMTRYALRQMNIFDGLVSGRAERQAHRGKTVNFTFATEMSAATTALDESTDVTAVAMGNSDVTVTLAEYGNATQITKYLAETSYLPVDPVMANLIAFNAALSLDGIAVAVLQAGTTVDYISAGGSRATVGATNTLTAAYVRKQLAAFRKANAMPYSGGNYAWVIHPDVSYDLRGETGAAAWRDPHTYSAPANIWNGEIGLFENFRFVEASSAPYLTDKGSSGGSGPVDVYLNLLFAQDAAVKVFADDPGSYPRVRPTPVTDKLYRFPGLGWYWLGAYAIIRQTALRRLECASSIGSNT